MTSIRSTAMLLAFAFAFALVPFASLRSSAHAQASAQGEADIELGATQPSDIERGAGASRRANAGRPADGGGDGLRLAIQARLDAINTLSIVDPDIDAPGPGGVLAAEGRRLLVPIVTPGVRLLDDHALFLGAGLGFAGFSAESGPNEDSRAGWSFSPLVSYDVLSDDSAALALLGWFNIASLGETEECDAGGCEEQNDDASAWGLSLGANLRGFIGEGLALGGEFGWGFLDVAFDDPNLDVFVHGVFGNIFLEASIGI